MSLGTVLGLVLLGYCVFAIIAIQLLNRGTK